MTKEEAFERVNKLWQEMTKHTYIDTDKNSFCLLAPLIIIEYAVSKVFVLASARDEIPIATAKWVD